MERAALEKNFLLNSLTCSRTLSAEQARGITDDTDDERPNNFQQATNYTFYGCAQLNGEL